MTTMGVLIFITVMSFISAFGGVFAKGVLSLLLLMTGGAFTILSFFLATPDQWYEISRYTIWVGFGSAFLAGLATLNER